MNIPVDPPRFSSHFRPSPVYVERAPFFVVHMDLKYTALDKRNAQTRETHRDTPGTLLGRVWRRAGLPASYFTFIATPSPPPWPRARPRLATGPGRLAPPRDLAAPPTRDSPPPERMATTGCDIGGFSFEAASSSSRGGGWALSGPASSWECRVAQSRRARSAEAPEPILGPA